MHLNDCEVSIREVRGQRLAVIVGPGKVTPAEGSALLDQYFATYTGPVPMYASPDGWQVLEPAPSVPELPAAAPAVEFDPPSADELPAPKRKK